MGTGLRDILFNAILLISLAFLYSTFDQRLTSSTKGKLINGLLIGFIGLTIMSTPMHFSEGIVFDTRSILLSLTGVFFGSVSTIVATIMLVAYRAHIGGGGALMGIVVILGSSFIGIMYRKYRFEKVLSHKHLRAKEMYVLSLIVHIYMIATMIFLPGDKALEVVRAVSIPVLLIYPVGSLILSLLLFRELDNIALRDKIEEGAERYKTLFYDNKANILLIDVETGNIIDANKKAQNFYGYSVDEISSMTIFDINVMDRAIVYDALKGYSKNPNDFYHFRHRSKSGEIRDVEVYINRVKLKGKEYNYSIIYDITERLKLESKINEQTYILKSIFNAIPDLIFLKDLKGRYLDCNPAFCSHAGKDKESIIGKTVIDVFGGMGSDYWSNDLRVIKEKKPLKFEEIVTKTDGREFVYDSIKTPLVDNNGEIWGILGVSRDITERKKLENDLFEMKIEAERANKIKSQFLANMSHEIRTPMNGIIGFLDVFEDTELTEEQSSYLKMIKTSSTTLLALINDILDITKIESGNIVLENISFDLRELAGMIALTFYGRAQAKGIAINLSIHKDVPKIIKGDPTKIKQVLANLLSNAVKFTDAGEVALKIDYLYSTRRGVKLSFKVIDSGIGISESDIQNLFKPFTQKDSSITRRYGGTGLGLAISKSLVELMGGEINILSSEGIGSEFSFDLEFDV